MSASNKISYTILRKIILYFLSLVIGTRFNLFFSKNLTLTNLTIGSILIITILVTDGLIIYSQTHNKEKARKEMIKDHIFAIIFAIVGIIINYIKNT